MISGSSVLSLLFFVAAAAAVAAATYAACPCKNPSWCESIKTGPRKEVLGFTTKSDHWPHYDWSKVTTLALFHAIDNATMDLVCYAHSKGVRVVITAISTSPERDGARRLRFRPNQRRESKLSRRRQHRHQIAAEFDGKVITSEYQISMTKPISEKYLKLSTIY